MEIGIKEVKAKSGKIYYYPYQKRERKPKGILCISKSGKTYYSYYKKKWLDGMARHSRLNQKRARERDNHQCQLCSSRHVIQVHHIDSIGVYSTTPPDNSTSNLITLCPSCHQRLHYGTFKKWDDIRALRNIGLTFQRIGNIYGVSRQCIQQICKKSLSNRQK